MALPRSERALLAASAACCSVINPSTMYVSRATASLSIPQPGYVFTAIHYMYVRDKGLTALPMALAFNASGSCLGLDPMALAFSASGSCLGLDLMALAFNASGSCLGLGGLCFFQPIILFFYS